MKIMMRRVTRLSALLLLSTQVVFADVTTPGAILRQLEQSEQHRKQEVEQPEKATPNIDIQDLDRDKKTQANNRIQFQLNEIRFNHSEILAQQTLIQLVAPYLHHPITLNDLNELLHKINSLYKDKGYLAAKAILPPQKIKKGVLRIQLIEGKIGEIQIQNNHSTDEDFILQRLKLKPDELVNIQHLEQQLQRLNLLTDIQVGAALKPGETVGKTRYLINVNEPAQHEAFIYTDNSGTKDVGLYRYGVNYTNRSVTGKRDRLNLGGYAADGTTAAYASYQFPLTTSGTTMEMTGNLSRIHIISGPVQALDISGQSSALGVELNYPIIVRNDHLVFWGLGAERKQSETRSSNVKLFDVRVNTMHLFIKEHSFSANRSHYIQLKGTFTPHNWRNEQPFFRINLDGSYSKKAGDWLATARMGAQWSDRRLLPSMEQFQVGGRYTVRGYKEGLLIGDRGYFASLELSHAVHEAIKPVLGKASRYLFFIDHGAAFAKKGNGQGINKEDYLLSAGIGLDIIISNRISAQLVAGKPIFKRQDNQDGGRINFTVQANFK